ncbi:hypothetical protein WICMUC_000988 [Wickerhamomyces mucosus]|uniref:NAD-dependent epimerase/dehydratase domain-containing protein n=1 Tax=Wickerhamomyces mucosus TaxID=1378264 RepID=A0A9P8TH71_9ASCO|nr:hypothetical protein WICMUC_000988 [Wickerhamomyces mucosus]
MSGKTVFVTGASGYIALHILDVLLSKGYNIIGTVRSQSKAESISNNFSKKYPEADIKFEIVPDISSDNAFDNSLRNNPSIDYVLHTASPFAYGIDKPLEEAYLIPATHGTRNVLEAIQKYAPQVTRVVITSSFAAIVNRGKAGDPTFIHTEETWNPITWEDVTTEQSGYTASKKLAEQLARNFVIEKKPNFTITTVNPPFVLGPQLFDDSFKNSNLNTSAELVRKLLDLPADYSGNDDLPSLVVDVRDVALLHVLPLENEKLLGSRLFPVSSFSSGQFLLNKVHEAFPELDGQIGKGTPEGAEEIAKTKGLAYDTSKTLEITGIKEWIPLEKTIRDSVQQILDHRKREE